MTDVTKFFDLGRLRLMKKRWFNIIWIIPLILTIVFVIAYLIPYVHPLKVKGVFVPFDYMVYADHVSIEAYKGEDSQIVFPSSLFGRKVTAVCENGARKHQFGYHVKSVVFPDSIEIIGEHSFSEAEELETVVWPKSLKRIGPWAFGNTMMSEIVLPDGVETIGRYAFCHNDYLKKVVLPKGVFIDEAAFYECSNLEEVSLPENVVMENSVFNDTKWIWNQRNEFLTDANQTLYWYNSNEQVIEIPEGIKRISHGALDGCICAQIIILPESVESVDSYALKAVEDVSKYFVFRNPDIILEENCISIYRQYDGSAITLVSPEGASAQQYIERLKEEGDRNAGDFVWMSLEEFDKLMNE